MAERPENNRVLLLQASICAKKDRGRLIPMWAAGKVRDSVYNLNRAMIFKARILECQNKGKERI